MLVALAFGEPPTLERPYGLPWPAGGPTAELKRDRGQHDRPFVPLVTADLGTDVSDAAGVRLAVVALGPFGGRWLFLKFSHRSGLRVQSRSLRSGRSTGPLVIRPGCSRPPDHGVATPGSTLRGPDVNCRFRPPALRPRAGHPLGVRCLARSRHSLDPDGSGGVHRVSLLRQHSVHSRLVRLPGLGREIRPRSTGV